MNEYQEFLKSKQKAKEHKGFAALQMNDKLFPFQQFIVERNLSKGKHAVFADCGLGKTIMELETATQIVRHTNKPVLILAPLVVVAQTQREAEKFGFDLDKVFRNAGDNLVPITHQDKEENKENYLPVNLWQKYAEPVWYDINYSDTLQYTSAREEKDEKHICPLQLETIRRCLHLWSNEGDTVLSPFGGIGSEGYESLRLNRNYIGIELKKSYYKQMQRNLKRMIADKMQPKLF